MPLLEKGAETFGAWNAVYEGQMETHLMVAITPAADCIVAAWKLDIDTKLVTGGSLSYTHEHPVYVLFNPWCLNDTVYMPGKYRSTSIMHVHTFTIALQLPGPCSGPRVLNGRQSSLI